MPDAQEGKETEEQGHETAGVTGRLVALKALRRGRLRVTVSNMGDSIVRPSS